MVLYGSETWALGPLSLGETVGRCLFQAKVTKDVLVIAAVVIGFTTGNIGPKNLERQGHGGSC